MKVLNLHQSIPVIQAFSKTITHISQYLVTFHRVIKHLETHATLQLQGDAVFAQSSVSRIDVEYSRVNLLISINGSYSVETDAQWKVMPFKQTNVVRLGDFFILKSHFLFLLDSHMKRN